MALAGDDDHIAGCCVIDGHRYRRGAIRFDHQATGRIAGDDLSDDRLRLLRARVVTGDDAPVGQLGGDAAHLWALAGVPITAASEYDDDSTISCGPGAIQHLSQRIWSVGVIDEDGKVLAL